AGALAATGLRREAATTAGAVTGASSFRVCTRACHPPRRGPIGPPSEPQRSGGETRGPASSPASWPRPAYAPSPLVDLSPAVLAGEAQEHILQCLPSSPQVGQRQVTLC